MDSATAFASYIRKLWENSGLSQTAWAKSVGLAQSSVQRWLAEENPTTPTLEQLDIVAIKLKKQGWELLRPDGAEPTPIPKPTVAEAIRILVEAFGGQLNGLSAARIELLTASVSLDDSEIAQWAERLRLASPTAPASSLDKPAEPIEGAQKPRGKVR